MRLPFLIATAALLGLALGCGAEESPPSGGGSGSGGSGSGQAGAAAGTPTAGGGAGGHAGASGSASPNAAGINAGGSATSAAGASAHAGSGGDASPPLSEACQEYCDCHDENCASTPIPGGKSCGAFCAAMTEEQLDCRQNMCGLVPAQPDNDHCDHSVGIDQCE